MRYQKFNIFVSSVHIFSSTIYSMYVCCREVYRISFSRKDTTPGHFTNLLHRFYIGMDTQVIRKPLSYSRAVSFHGNGNISGVDTRIELYTWRS